MDDDDVPPPLSSLPEQLQALKLKGLPKTVAAGEEVPDSDLPTASTTIVGPATRAKVAPDIKRGFFDSKPKPKPKPPPQPALAVEEITVLKGKKGSGFGQGGPSIPDFLRVEPDEQTKKLEEVKGKLVNALKPTPESIAQISSNPDLLAGFQDPEVMAAVHEISKDPSKVHTKYKDNMKVLTFYKAMAAFAGSQLEAQGDKPL